VWNLDADCAELTTDERQRHAETLRANVAGAHELFLVDARAALRAMQTDDAGASVASGLTALIAALTRFVSSGGREIAALREAAKRTHERLAAAQDSLRQRQAALDQALGAARARLQAVQAAADTQVAAARSRFGECEQALTRAAQQARATAAQHAAALRRELRAARRRWARSGHIGALQAAVAAATARYADAVAAANGDTGAAVHDIADRFGTRVAVAARPRTVPTVEELAPEDRYTRATRGRWQRVRRMLWHRWYLPGLAALERTGIGNDLNAQAQWVSSIGSTAGDAAAATLAANIDAITQRAAAEQEQIKVETTYGANQAEFERLGQDLPVVATQYESAARIATEARALL